MRERTWFVAGGALLLVLAAAFLWNDLQLQPELLVTVMALGASATMLFAPRRWTAAALLAATLLSGAWYAATRADLLLPGLVLLLGGSITAVVTARDDEPTRKLAWAAVTAAGLVVSWALYFRFLTVGFAANEVARRLVLTLAWLATGVVLVLSARARPAGEQLSSRHPARTAGLVFTAAAFGKALVYDTTHLSGPLRVAVLAAAGALLMVGGSLLRGEA